MILLSKTSAGLFEVNFANLDFRLDSESKQSLISATSEVLDISIFEKLEIGKHLAPTKDQIHQQLKYSL